MGVTLVDSSVWIDFLRDKQTSETDLFVELVKTDLVATGDLVMAEVLQGCRSEREYLFAHHRLTLAVPVIISDHRIAAEAARNYRTLRAKGITVRKTIDTLIATRCIRDCIPLLYSDRDFDPFVEHLGLRSALHHHTGIA